MQVKPLLPSTTPPHSSSGPNTLVELAQTVITNYEGQDRVSLDTLIAQVFQDYRRLPSSAQLKTFKDVSAHFEDIASAHGQCEWDFACKFDWKHMWIKVISKIVVSTKALWPLSQPAIKSTLWLPLMTSTFWMAEKQTISLLCKAVGAAKVRDLFPLQYLTQWLMSCTQNV
jgi:hypothetical protein